MWFKRKKNVHPLDKPLFNWTPNDPFRVRDLLNGGCLILGRAGSGKTSSSGKKLMQSIVNNGQSWGLILAAKPEDAQDVERVFAKARRLKDLIIFDAEGGNRCNFLACLKRPRDVVQFIITMSEVMARGDGKGGGENSQFYAQQTDAHDLQRRGRAASGGGAVDGCQPPSVYYDGRHESGGVGQAGVAAQVPQHGFGEGFKANKTPMEAHDFTLYMDFWLNEWAILMDARTRGNILAGVQGTTHIMNIGIVRETVCGETNVTPADILAGKWL